MFAFIGSRHEMLGHLPKAQMKAIAEVGVCEGINAEWLYTNLEPETLHLVDLWQAFAKEEPPFYYQDGPDGQRFIETYFGGPVTEQATFDRLYEKALARFSDKDNVTIYKKSSAEAVLDFADQSLDMIYIDADHSYEAVLHDLFLWHPKLKDAGYLVLNDHTINASGTAKFGIVQAVTTFLRNQPQYQPLALNISNYADLIIGKRTVNHAAFLKSLITSGKVFELPDSILSNFHRRQTGHLSWLSFN